MKIRTAMAAGLLLAAAGFLLAAESAHLIPASPDGSVTIKGTSSLHAWQVTGSTISGSIETDPESWKSAGPGTALVKVSIPVASIHSDHADMDKLMFAALKSEANPDIVYAMTSAAFVEKKGDSFVVRTSGKLTVAGATHDLAMDVAVDPGAGKQYTISGEAPIKMSDYGIKPPVAMMGMLKTGDNVTVEFHWILNRS